MSKYSRQSSLRKIQTRRYTTLCKTLMEFRRIQQFESARWHTITYSYTDGNGCSNSISVDAVVIDCELGIDENALDGVTLFPNPNQGVFAIEGVPIGTEYSIYDKRGRIVAKGIIESDSHQVELTNVEGGMYYLNATLNGENGSLRFIIAK